MRRGRTLILILLIIIIGVVVAFVAITQLLGSQTPEENAPIFVDVYYAAQNIPQGAPITEDLLATLQMPQANVVTVMFTADELPLLIGKVAKFPLDQGVVITETMVSDASAAVPVSGPEWASLIPPGMTAMSIPTDRLSVSGYAVNDGAHVNINACLLFVDVDPSYQTILPNLTAVLTGTGLGNIDGGGAATGEGSSFSVTGLPILSLGVAASGAPQGRLELDPSVQQPYYVVPSEPQRPRLVCQMLLQDVIVLKLGNFTLVPEATTAEQQQDPNAQPAAPVAPDLVTLVVSPQDSITLSYLVYSNAKLMLTLRNPSDQSRVASEASTLQFLLSQYNIPVPAKLPYAMQPALTTLISPSLPNDAPTPAPEQ
jgi:Flp pilus assembly protein CpaB